MYAGSTAAEKTGQGCSPTVTLFSDAVSENEWPVRLSVLPALAVVGSAETIMGVLASAKPKPQPPMARHATLCVPDTAMRCRVSSTVGGGGGAEGGGGKIGGVGGGTVGGKRGGALGGGGGSEGGGDGSKRCEQSAQSVP